MTAVPFVLRDHREQLWRRWAESLGDVAADYRELMSSPLGERFVRAFIDDLIAWSEAEEYEATGPAPSRRADRIATDASHRMSLGFTALDLAMALQKLRGAIIDVLLDALVLGELPSFAETLEQVKAADGFIDRLVAAVFSAVPDTAPGE